MTSSSTRPDGEPDGYQPLTQHGPKVRTDVVDVYVFRRVAEEKSRAVSSGGSRVYEGDPGWPRRGGKVVEFLQVLRASEPLKDSWHPVMGHVHEDETAAQCARREMLEELGLLHLDRAVLGMWALEQVHPFYIDAINTIVMSPRFCVEVAEGWSPRLNEEHSAHRWVAEGEIDAKFMWPGQKACCREILREIVSDASLSREGLRVK